jgi:methionyl-tRNA formyltransferase
VSRIRAVFLGTPEIARKCLEAMIKDEHFEVVGVVSQPDRPAGRKLQLTPSPVKALAQSVGIPSLTPEKINTEEAMIAIRAWRAEVAVVVAFGQILSQNFLDLFPQRIVNVHASLLPRWRGAAPVQRALMSGDTETGVSLQIVVRKMDAGSLLGIRRIPLDEEINAIDVFERLPQLATELITIELMDYLRGNLTPLPQDESQITMAPKIDKAEAEIDWSQSSDEIHNKVRGLAAGPVASTSRGGKIVKVHRTKVEKSSAAGLLFYGSPGQILAGGHVNSASALHVVCGQGVLEILKLQPESKAAMSAQDYLRGYPVTKGDHFESVSRRT